MGFPKSHRQATRLLQGGLIGLALALLLNLFGPADASLTILTMVVAIPAFIAVVWGLAWLVAHPIRRGHA